jgi:hypothetical protein
MQSPLNTWWKKIKATVSSQGGEFRRNAKTSWISILTGFMLGVTVVLIVGYVTYFRAVVDEDGSVTAPVSRSPLRTTDVKAVIDTYQMKKEKLNLLLSNKPLFLSPAKGAITPPKEEVIEAMSTSSTTNLPL